MHVNRRRFLQAGAAGAAGAALLPAAGCSMDETGLARPAERAAADHRQPAARTTSGAYGSPQVKTPNVDALAARGLRFNRAFPEAMVTIPARRSIFTSKRIFPFRDWKPNLELGTQPRLAADRRRRAHVHERAAPPRLLDRAGVRQPAPRLHQGLRARSASSFDHWKSVPGQSGTFKPASTVPLETRLRLAAAVPARRALRARACASTWPTRGAGVREDETCAARVYKEAIDTLDARPPAPAVLHGRRLLRPARAVEPGREVRRHVQATRATRARRSA